MKSGKRVNILILGRIIMKNVRIFSKLLALFNFVNWEVFQVNIGTIHNDKSDK